MPYFTARIRVFLALSCLLALVPAYSADKEAAKKSGASSSSKTEASESPGFFDGMKTAAGRLRDKWNEFIGSKEMGNVRDGAEKGRDTVKEKATEAANELKGVANRIEDSIRGDSKSKPKK